MKVAFEFSIQYKFTEKKICNEFISIFEKNYFEYKQTKINTQLVFDNMSKDKKNIDGNYKVILPVGKSLSIKPILLRPDQKFFDCLDMALKI